MVKSIVNSKNTHLVVIMVGLLYVLFGTLHALRHTGGVQWNDLLLAAMLIFRGSIDYVTIKNGGMIIP